MLKVGVTGGIGSGKSIICQLFKCIEIPIFNADETGRLLLSEESSIIEKVKDIFGEQVIINGKPGRKEIAKLVFTDPGKLAQLNAIIHPAVRKKFNEWAAEQDAPYVIDEAAILFETGFYKQLDYIIVVCSPEELRIKRIAQRDNMDENAIRNRIKNQWSEEEKMKLADFVIYNDDINPLLPQVMDIHHKLMAKAT